MDNPTKQIAILLCILKKNASKYNDTYADGYISALIDVRYSIANYLRDNAGDDVALEFHKFITENS